LEKKVTTPTVLGRLDTDAPEDTPDPRAKTTLSAEVRVPFEGGAVGQVTVQIFRSEGDEDRGGVVIRVTIDDQGSSFIPHASLLPNGVELHIAGDIEGRSVVTALRAALHA
jgi:hypothetical protein